MKPIASTDAQTAQVVRAEALLARAFRTPIIYRTPVFITTDEIDAAAE